MPRILLVDDEIHVLKTMEKFLKKHDFEDVDLAQDGQSAMKALGSLPPYELCFLDLIMPDINGMDVLRYGKENNIKTQFIMMTGHPSINTAITATRIGVVDYIKKPLVFADIITQVNNLIGKQSERSYQLAHEIDQFVKRNANNSCLSLQILSEQFSLSRRYITLLFKKNIGSSFRERLILYRIKKAKDIMRSEQWPLYMIAEECGFKHQSRLSEAFQRYENITPKQYQIMLARENPITSE